jgi:hypothetical protein
MITNEKKHTHKHTLKKILKKEEENNALSTWIKK